MNNSVQSFNFGNIAVSFREDGYLNATQIAAHFGKLPKDYLKTEQTQQYISALAESLSERTKILTDENQLVIVKKGNSKTSRKAHGCIPNSLFTSPVGLIRNLRFGVMNKLKLYLTAKFQTAPPPKPPPTTVPDCAKPSPHLSDAKA